MGSKWKKLKLLLRKRMCMISPSERIDLDPDSNMVGSVRSSRSQPQPISKSMSRGASFGGYNTGPMIIIDTSDVNAQRSAPSTPPPSFSGPIMPSCPGQSTGIRIPRSTCSICLVTMKPGQGQALFTAECSHTFHFSCIASSVRHGNQVCPICRAKWKDLPWQAGLEVSRSRETHRTARLATSHQADVGGSHADSFSGEEGRRSRNLSLQYLDESILSRVFHPGEPDSYNDDEPLNLNQSGLLHPSVGGMSGGSLHHQSAYMTALSEVSAVPACESRQCFTVLVHLKAPGACCSSSTQALTSSAGLGQRTPLDLVAVLDISGSMAGSKLLLLKQAMSFVVYNLSAADRLSVVSFSTTAKRIFPLRNMGADGQRQALQAIDELVAMGGTNIAEGLRKGLKVLEDRREKNPVSSIMLLSDGQDTFCGNNCTQLPIFLTRGMSDRRRLVPQMIRRSASVGRAQIPVHTFGFGSDHDAATMHSISEVSGGTFSYIQAEEVVQDAFAQCIGGLLSVVMQDVQIEVTCLASGVRISSIHSGSYESSILESARDSIIKLGDLYANEERDILVDLELPAVSACVGESCMPLVQAMCSYKDPVRQGVVCHITPEGLCLMRPLAVEDGQNTISLEVDRQRNRLRTAEAIADARLLADQGKMEAAQCGLREARVQLGASPSARAGDELCSMLESELNEIQERMATRQMYETSGRAYVLSAQSSHLRQRATTRGDSVDTAMHDYRTPSMVDMINLSQTLLSPKRPSTATDRSGLCDNATSPLNPPFNESLQGEASAEAPIS